jgi:hypothetical protein
MGAAEREHPAMATDERARLDASRDGSPRDAVQQELLEADDTALPLGQGENVTPRVAWGRGVTFGAGYGGNVTSNAAGHARSSPPRRNLAPMFAGALRAPANEESYATAP